MVTLGKHSEDNKFLEPVDVLGGQLFLVKTIIFYDYPLLFVCQNDADELFMFNEMKDEPSFLEWGVIKITPEALEQFCKQQISFRELYKICEDNYFIIGAVYDESSNFGTPLKIYMDNNKKASKSYKELLEFYNDDRKLHYHLYDDIGESND